MTYVSEFTCDKTWKFGAHVMYNYNWNGDELKGRSAFHSVIMLVNKVNIEFHS